MRAKRVILICLAIAALFVTAYLLKFLNNQHRFVSTVGMIVFASDQGSPGHSHIWTVASDGTNPHALTTGNFNDVYPSYSADGSEITFVSDRSGSQEVYVMDGDGQNAKAITIGSDAKISPEFSPDGNHIAYIASGRLSIIDLVAGSSDLILPATDTTEAQGNQELAQVARAPVLGFKWQPLSDFSKVQIAAIQQSPDSDIQGVSLVPASGGKPTVVAEAQTISLDWSPDAATLAIAALGVPVQHGKLISGIFLFDASGKPLNSPPLAAAPTDKFGPQEPSFFPDGTKITFVVTMVKSEGVTVPVGVAIASLGSATNIQEVVKGAAKDPVFSPDGTHAIYLAPSSVDSSKQELWIVGSQNQPNIAVTKGQGNVTSAEWSPAKPKAQ